MRHSRKMDDPSISTDTSNSARTPAAPRVARPSEIAHELAELDDRAAELRAKGEYLDALQVMEGALVLREACCGARARQRKGVHCMQARGEQ